MTDRTTGPWPLGDLRLLSHAPSPFALWWEWLYRSGATTYTEGVGLRPVDIKKDEESHGTVPVWLHGLKQEARKRDGYQPTEFCE